MVINFCVTIFRGYLALTKYCYCPNYGISFIKSRYVNWVKAVDTYLVNHLKIQEEKLVILLIQVYIDTSCYSWIQT